MKRLSEKWKNWAWNSPSWGNLSELQFRLFQACISPWGLRKGEDVEEILRQADEAWAAYRRVYEAVLRERPPEYEDAPEE